MKSVYRNIIILAVFFILIVCIWHIGNVGHYINLKTIKDNQQFLIRLIHKRPIFSGITYSIIFFIVTLTALPATLALLAIGGFLFGTLTGSLYALAAMLASSVTVFTLSKRMFGNYVQHKYAHELAKFNNNFKHYGFYYLIIVRAVPIIPFFIVNAAAGFTRMSTQTFIISTLIGVIPTIVVCCYLGSQCATFIVNW